MRVVSRGDGRAALLGVGRGEQECLPYTIAGAGSDGGQSPSFSSVLTLPRLACKERTRTWGTRRERALAGCEKKSFPMLTFLSVAKADIRSKRLTAALKRCTTRKQTARPFFICVPNTQPWGWHSVYIRSLEATLHDQLGRWVICGRDRFS